MQRHLVCVTERTAGAARTGGGASRVASEALTEPLMLGIPNQHSLRAVPFPGSFCFLCMGESNSELFCRPNTGAGPLLGSQEGENQPFFPEDDGV